MNLKELMEPVSPPGATPSSSRVAAREGHRVAVIGVACRYPGAPDKERFWSCLRDGWDPVGPFPESRRADVEPFFELFNSFRDLKLDYVPGAYLETIDRFDYRRFKLSPREAALMDPAHRLFLECAVAAMEDAGYGGEALAGSRTGVFVGFAPDFRACNYKDILLQLDRSLAPLVLQANLPPILPARISYFLDLHGPAVCLDTACSSSLVAVHLACLSLRRKECTFALAGGVKLNLLPLDTDVKVGIESEDGYTRPFDDGASGTGVGEGVGVVLLKSYHQARRDGDHIYAVIEGSAVGQDGRSAGITAPDPDAQADTLVRAWEDAGIGPEDLDWIEAHGTGTRIGDPVEVAGITTAVRRLSNRRQFCAITSLKGNLNHLFEGSGIASLVKACLSLEHEAIPPMIRFETPNRTVDLADSPVYPNLELRPWPRGTRRRRCGISAFGMSGTNCHLVLGEAPRETIRPSRKEAVEVFTVSGLDGGRLRAFLVRYRDHFRRNRTLRLEDVCFTANTGRGHYRSRVAVLARSLEELEHKLARCLEEGVQTDVARGVFVGGVDGDGLGSGEAGAGDWPKDLAALCRRYVSGEEVDWRRLYDGREVRRVSLPPYPGERSRCWYEPPEDMLDAWQQRRTVLYEAAWSEASRDREPESVQDVLLVARPGQAGIVDEVAQALGVRGVRVHRYTVETADHAASLVSRPWFAAVSHIVHCQVLDLPPERNWAEHLELERWGVRSLFHLARAVGRAARGAVTLAVLTDGASGVGGKAPVPSKAALAGMTRALAREEETWDCRAIDLVGAVGVERVVEEIQTEDKAVWRTLTGGQRFVQEFRPVVLEPGRGRPLRLEEDGVYLITGGTGGLGVEVARHLAEQHRVNLALLSRHGMVDPQQWPRIIAAGNDPRLVARVRSLSRVLALGSHLSFPVADTADPEAMAQVLENLRARYGRIRGVVHCAGVPSAHLLVQKTEPSFEQVVFPKTRGGWLLESLTREDDLDFFVLFSSVASLFPAVGQVDYAAANTYLDALAHRLAAAGKRALAIDWVAWKEVGMAADTGVAVDTIFKALDPSEALQALQTALDHGLTHVLAGRLNYDDERIRMIERQPLNLAPAIARQLARRQHGRPVPVGPKADRRPARPVRLVGRSGDEYTDTERVLAAIWGESLGYEELDVEADFYDLGGDSIQALRILNRIRERFGIHLEMTDVLACRTLKAAAALVAERQAASAGEPAAPAAASHPTTEPVTAPLSSQQRRMYALYRMNPDSVAYNIPVLYRLQGTLDRPRFQKSLDALVARHEALRTCFVEREGRIVQQVLPTLSTTIETVQGEDAVAQVARSLLRPFRLDTPPLFRVAVIEGPADHTHVFFDVHHILADGASVAVLLEDLAALYAGVELPLVRASYRDHVTWQQSEEAGRRYSTQERYWKTALEAHITGVSLPHDPVEKTFDPGAGRRYRFDVPREEVEQLRHITRRAGTTLFSLLLAAYAVVLARYARDQVVAVGVPVSGRTDARFERTVGLFVNTVVVTLKPRMELGFKDFLQETSEVVRQVLANQDYPYEEVVRRWRAARGAGMETPISTLFVLQNQPPHPIRSGDLELVPVDFDPGTARFDLTVELVETVPGLTGWVEYRKALYLEDTIARFVAAYQRVLSEVGRDPSIQLGALASADEVEDSSGPDLSDLTFDL